jgi:hypothetical protein
MSSDLLKNFVVKIKYCIDDKAIEGSGVIFKPEKKSKYGYIHLLTHKYII